MPAGRQIRLDGDAPFVNTSDTSEHPAKGARLSEKDAGQYYLEAVKPSIQPLRDAMNTLYGGDLKATRAAAGKAATVLRATAKALRSRTWPDEVANAAAVVANEYDAKARQASYVADSVTLSASDELISLDAYGVSEADVYLRGKLGLPPPRRRPRRWRSRASRTGASSRGRMPAGRPWTPESASSP